MNTPDLKASKLDCIQRTFSGDMPYFISLNLCFEKYPDLTRMQKAVSLLSEAVPVLSADFDASSSGWIYTDRQIEITNFSGTTDDTVEYLNNLSADAIPFSVLYIKKSNTLILTVDHAITDAHGLLQLSKILCTAYRALKTDPSYKIPKTIREREFSLTEKMTKFPEKICIELCQNEIDTFDSVKMWLKYLTPIEPVKEKYQFHIRKISPKIFSAAKSRAKKHGATVNDLLKTAFAVSIQKHIFEKDGVMISVVPMRQANDLRKYLPEDMRLEIGNFSVPCWSPVECGNSDFSEILEKAALLSLKLKEHPTAPGVLFAVENPENPISRILIKNDCSPSASLSNTGIIPPEAVDFGEDLKVIEAALYSDFRFGNPYFLIASTYDGQLSLIIITKSAGVEYAEKILDETEKIISGFTD
ncbi:MAG: hypothetical protein Q4Q53_00240 [Methanocorpusculum sp.]|nr:hypothetical protein [Methanocorpusculum sp.]